MYSITTFHSKYITLFICINQNEPKLEDCIDAASALEPERKANGAPNKDFVFLLLQKCLKCKQDVF